MVKGEGYAAGGVTNLWIGLFVKLLVAEQNMEHNSASCVQEHDDFLVLIYRL